MPVYDFTVDLRPRPQAVMTPGASRFPAAGQQLSDAQGGNTRIQTGGPLVDPSDVREFVMPGFYALDAAMKMYWSGMRVPTKDSYRFCRIKIAGGDRTFMIWRDDMLNGRVRLPVGSLNQGKIEFNKDKFSPAYLPMAVRYPTKRGDRAVVVYRPVPWLVDYTFSVWSEFKRDAEYLKYQILTRFNPMAGFMMYDGHLQGNIWLRFGGCADQSEKEAAADQQRLIKYDYQITAEAWLPLPERLVPTVLSQVASVKDFSGNVMQVLAGL